jgi:hypothetical protein
MSAVTNTWRQLVQRRLWPVAILLIAALVAVPLLLAKQPTPPAPPPAVAANDEQSKSELAVTPIVTQADAPTKRRRVLGSAKNPFAKKAVDDAVTASNAPTGTSQTTTGTGGAETPAPSVDAGLGGGSSEPAPTGPTPPVSLTPPAVPEPPAKKYSLHELTVRFGDASGGSERRSVERLDPLPSAEEPVLIYLGLRKDGKTAVFLVDHGVQAVGDGECVPFPEQCERIFLRAGETEFLDVVDATGQVTAQYQLDLIKIHNKGTKASAAKARLSAKAEGRALQARASIAGRSAGLG